MSTSRLIPGVVPLLLMGCAASDDLDLAAASGVYALTLDGVDAGEVSVSFSSDGTRIVTSFGAGEAGALDERSFRVAFEESWVIVQYVDGNLERSEHIERLVYDATFVGDDRFEGTHTTEATCEGIHCGDRDAWALETYALAGVRE